jgi:hypothetical protein
MWKQNETRRKHKHEYPGTVEGTTILTALILGDTFAVYLYVVQCYDNRALRSTVRMALADI